MGGLQFDILPVQASTSELQKRHRAIYKDMLAALNASKDGGPRTIAVARDTDDEILSIMRSELQGSREDGLTLATRFQYFEKGTAKIINVRMVYYRFSRDGDLQRITQFQSNPESETNLSESDQKELQWLEGVVAGLKSHNQNSKASAPQDKFL